MDCMQLLICNKEISVSVTLWNFNIPSGINYPA